MDVCFPHPINNTQFASLFTPDIDTYTWDSLSDMAAAGHQDSLDILLQIALRNDEQGAKAEQQLFDLYCNKVPSFAGVSQQIAESALALYLLYGEKQTDDNAAIAKMTSPSRLLYLAGAAGHMGQKQDIANRLERDSHGISNDDGTFDNDLWHPARRLDSDEIYQSLVANHAEHRASVINYPIGLKDPQGQRNLLMEQIEEQRQNPTFLAQPEIYPINTGNHWVVFGLYQTAAPAEKRCAFIFDSANALTHDDKQQFIAAAQHAGVESETQITFIQKNIQQHVSNGCGVFTVDAINTLLEQSNPLPEVHLQNYLENFARYSREQQLDFNREKRSQIYERAFLSPNMY